ncbi:transglycosylase [Salmonella enterica subsp. enterica]|nr:transglycosylase [Salmonella enterica subsp. enterica serovar Typhimurium]ECH1286317.1 transglycosylase [Salmonella enterica subsp. enterica serovar Typhimurium]ECK0317892.1 transglycosylase [Salmonella enterica subsp. enterica serovar Typhimurium]ECR1804332.1 transglycosylase [Salmonella enterica subsp. enterica serovar Typhimurium]
MGQQIAGLAEYTNVPKTIATVLSSGKCSLTELSTTLGVQDLWWWLEIIDIDNYNQMVIDRASEAW